VEAGAHVINISGGQFAKNLEPNHFLENAVKLCEASNVLIVAAAGNDGCDCLHFPAAIPSVLSVGAMDDAGVPLCSSNWGSAYRGQGILAPGSNILGPVPGGRLKDSTGTSFATPIVSGVIGLLLSLQEKQGHPIDPFRVRDVLLQSAHPCDPRESADCRRHLRGGLNAEAAYHLLQSSSVLDQVTPQSLSKTSTARAVTKTNFASIEAYQIGEMRMSETRENSQAEEAILASEHTACEPVQSMPKVQAAVQASGLSQRAPVSGSQQAHGGNRASSFPGGATAWAHGLPMGSGSVSPSECADGGCDAALVYALGNLEIDFGTQARRDSFSQAMGQNPDDSTQLLAHFTDNPWSASNVIWTLNLDGTPIYAIQPSGPHTTYAYEHLREMLKDQLEGGVERVSIPGISGGSVTLMSGQTVPYLVPDVRGMYSWNTAALLESVCGPVPEEPNAEYDSMRAGLDNFLSRIYYELRNLGGSPQERAMNYAATNAFQAGEVFTEAALRCMELDTISVEQSPVSRPGSDCLDVKMVFFNPAKRLEQARKVHRFTIDVSDIVPVTIGPRRSWSVY